MSTERKGATQMQQDRWLVKDNYGVYWYWTAEDEYRWTESQARALDFAYPSPEAARQALRDLHAERRTVAKFRVVRVSPSPSRSVHHVSFALTPFGLSLSIPVRAGSYTEAVAHVQRKLTELVGSP